MTDLEYIEQIYNGYLQREDAQKALRLLVSLSIDVLQHTDNCFSLSYTDRQLIISVLHLVRSKLNDR